jgi:hypothetical protein
MKLAFWGLFSAGFVACATLGIGPTLIRAGGNWTSPFVLAGCVLGIALVALGVAFATGVRTPLLPSDGSMVLALGVLLAVKVGVSLVQVASSALSR